MNEFIGTCVNLMAEDLYDYDDSERSITYRTFRQHVGMDVIKEINENTGFPICRDWAVSFGKGKWKGKPCVCMHHSAIHHLWYI